MKTVKQVAIELGVSRQCIYRQLSAIPSVMLSTDNKGIQLITMDGVLFLKNKLSGKVSVGQSTDSQADNSDSTMDKVLSMLYRELDAKNEQLVTKDKHISELTATIKILSESIKSTSQNELAETIFDNQKKALGDGREKKIGFFQRLFQRKNND